MLLWRLNELLSIHVFWQMGQDANLLLRGTLEGNAEDARTALSNVGGRQLAVLQRVEGKIDEVKKEIRLIGLSKKDEALVS